MEHTEEHTLRITMAQVLMSYLHMAWGWEDSGTWIIITTVDSEVSSIMEVSDIMGALNIMGALIITEEDMEDLVDIIIDYYIYTINRPCV